MEQALSSQLLLKKLLGPLLFALNQQRSAVVRAEALLRSVSDLDQLPSNHPDRVHIALLHAASLAMDNISRTTEAPTQSYTNDPAKKRSLI
jgi:hypothetical protein